MYLVLLASQMIRNLCGGHLYINPIFRMSEHMVTQKPKGIIISFAAEWNSSFIAMQVQQNSGNINSYHKPPAAQLNQVIGGFRTLLVKGQFPFAPKGDICL